MYAMHYLDKPLLSSHHIYQKQYKKQQANKWITHYPWETE